MLRWSDPASYSGARERAGPVALDTCVYIVEANPTYGPLLDPLLVAMTEGRLMAVTSALTLLEVLVVPLRAADSTLADKYEESRSQSGPGPPPRPPGCCI